MNLLEELKKRSGNQCELCAAKENLSIYEVKPTSTGGVDGSLLACETCIDQIDDLSRNYDYIFIVDTSNPAQLSSFMKILNNKYIILIDHHHPRELAKKSHLAIIDVKAASTTELITSIASTLGIIIPESIASLGIAGIYYDTGRFKRIGRYTAMALDYLVQMGGKPITITLEEAPFSERYARLIAASRSMINRVCKEIILAFTFVGSFESSVARSLIDIGTDVAVVVGGHDDIKRVSIRISDRALRSGITARDIAIFIGRKYNGEGGGHDQAAMAHIPWEKEAKELASELYRSLPGKVARMCVEARENESRK